ncbi:CoA ester lyase [Streptomyces sp. ISL-98]|uniref:HpcH/HpaI aldolase/citrate lyase family protein n=1 Tax=Streptomyces sp. ISL-98 TaxID=2819192 RepID=UPI001BE6DF0A|nr:aldolase/citrate lyase family protein [Streptomyces sp. ISL-98]MBT2505892.1 CoA ester lyase [Streptomyces sp. ISL-98]
MSPSPDAARSWIITPGHVPTRFPSAHTCGADVALVDLEDSVPPASKPDARHTASAFFTARTPGCILGIRISSPATLDGITDLAAITAYPAKPAIVLIPKVESARDIELVAGVLDTPDYTAHLYALIETPRALENLPSIVRSPRITGVLFGAADYAATTGCEMAWEPLLHARSMLVTSAAAARIPAIDSPFFDLDNLDGLRSEAEQVLALGFAGKSCVHPRHLPVIADVFKPTEEEIAAARAIVAAGHDAGGRITAVKGQMIGPPMVLAARALLARTGSVTDQKGDV